MSLLNPPRQATPNIKRMLSKKGVLFAVTSALAGLFLTVTLWRLQFGVDFSDESFYLAQSYRFLLGDRPFIDDHLLLSTMAFVTLPLLKLYTIVVGSLTGAILYFRFLHFLLSILTGMVVFHSLKPYFKGSLPRLTALIPIIYLHHQIPTLSYNTMALHFWTMGTFLLMGSLIDRTFYKKACILASVAYALLCIVYPPLTLVVLLQWIVLIAVARPKITEGFKLFIGPLIILLLFSYWIRFEWNQIFTLIGATQKAGGAGGFSKLWLCITDLWNLTPYKLLILPLGALTLWLPDKIRPIAILGVFAPAFLSRATAQTSGFAMHVLGYPYYFALFGPFIYFLIRSNAKFRTIFLAVYPMSFIAGIATAWSASYGVSTFGYVVGLFPAFIICAVLFSQHLSHRAPLEFGSISLVLILLCLIYYQRIPFKDESIFSLNTRISGGPFHFLKTTEGRAKDEFTMRQGIEQYNDRSGQGPDKGTGQESSQESRRIFVFESMPALYLYSTLRPAASVLYRTCMEGRLFCRQHYENQYSPQNVVAHVKPFRYNLDVLSLDENKLAPNDPVITYIKTHHRKVFENSFYTIYSGG